MVYTIKCEAQTITFNPGGTVCESDTVTATFHPACPVAGATYVWSYGGGVSKTTSGPGPMRIKWASTGSHTVTVTETNGACSHTGTQNITIKGIDSANATFTFAPSNACEGEPVILAYTGGLNLPSYNGNYQFGNPISVNAISSDSFGFVYGSPGTVVTEYSFTDGVSGCTSDVVTVPIRIKPVPSDTFTYTTAGCKEATVKHVGFADNKSTYTWNVGGGGTPVPPGNNIPAMNDTGPANITWAAAGMYTVTLVSVSDTNGCSSGPYSVPITVTNNAPNYGFTVSPASACEGDPVTVTYTGGSPAAANYLWSFGAGFTIVSGTGQGPYVLTYTGSGTKNITLQVTSGNCSSLVSPAQTVTIKATPTSGISATDTACTNGTSTITYLGTPSGTATYTWGFGTGTGGVAGAGPQVITWPATQTVHNVTLSVTDNGCTSPTTTIPITTVNPYTSTFTTSLAAICNTATPVTLTYTGNAGVAAANVTYNWNLAGGTAVTGTGRGPLSVTWGTTGTKSIILTVSNGGCTSTPTTKTVTVANTPISTFTVDNDSVCIGGTTKLTFTGSASGAATYAWTTTGGTPATATGVGPQTITWNTAGTFTPKLVVTDNTCVSTATTATVVVSSLFTSTFTALPAAVCGTGTPVTVTYTGNAVAGAIYNWNFGGGTVISGTGKGPYSISWPTAGPQTVTLTVGNGNCTSTLTSKGVTVNAIPTSTFTLDRDSVCVGGTTKLAFTGSASGAATYAWTTTGGTPATATGVGPQTITWNTAGTFTPKLVVTDNTCVSTATTATVVVSTIYTSTFTALPAVVCGTGTPVTVTYTGNAPGTATFNWNFGGGTVISGTGAGPYSVSWPTAGPQTVTLTVGNGNCTSILTSKGVTVNAIPTSTFTLDHDSICVGGTTKLTFTGTASGAATYAWTTTGGTPGIAVGVGPQTITWNTAGTFTPKLVVTDNTCISTATTATVVVSSLYTSGFTALPALVCGTGTPVTITYTGNAPNTAAFNWNFGGGTVISGASNGPYTVSWPTAGPQTVTLTLGGGSCTSALTSKPVTVNAIPTSTFTVDHDSLCVGGTTKLTFTGAASGAATYAWTTAGGTPATATGVGPQNITWNTAGTFTPKLVVTDNTCVSTAATATVVVSSLYTSTFTALPAAVCGTGTPVTVTYTGNAPAGAAYNWNFGGGTVISGSSGGPYSISWPTAGPQTVTLTLGGGSCTSVLTPKTVTVNAIPTSTFTVDNDSVCVGGTTKLTFTGAASGAATYAWTTTGGTPATATGVGPQTITWSTAGTFTPKLVVTDNTCVSTVTTATIVVSNLYTSTFTALPAAVCGTGTPVTVTYTGDAPGTATFNWNFGGGTVISGSGAGPYSVSWPTTGPQTIGLTVGNANCTSGLNTKTVTVNAIPTSTFTVDKDSICVGGTTKLTFTGAASGAATYAWTTTGGAPATAVGAGPQTITWNTAGTFTPQLVVTDNTCVSTATTATVVVSGLYTSSLTALPALVCGTGTPVAINYTGNAPGTANFNWNFGGGTVISGTGAGPYSVSWPTTGPQTIGLTVGNANCTSILSTKTITVNAVPTSAFTIDHDSICVGGTTKLTFAGVASGAATYAWTITGGTPGTATGAGPQTITWGTAGTFAPQLVVTDNTCVSTPTTSTVVVSGLYTSSFTALPATVCGAGTPVTITYTGNAPNTAAFNWNFNGGTVISGSSAGPYTISWPSIGPQTVGLILGGGSCTSALTTQNVTVYAIPTSTFTADNDSICSGTQSVLTYTGTASPAAIYNWSFFSGNATPGGTSQGPQTVTWSGTGNFVPTLTVTENGCTSSLSSATVVVGVIPTSPFNTSVASVCGTGTPVTITFTGTASVNATYAWNFAGGTIISGTGAGPYSVSWTTGGSKSITLTVKDGVCSSTQTTQTVQVNAIPSSSFTVDHASICLSQTSTFTYAGTPIVGATYAWTFVGGTPSTYNTDDAPPAITWTAAGTHKAYLTVNNNGCQSTLDSVTVTVGGTYSSSFTVSAPTLCGTGTADTLKYTGNAPVGATYTWFPDGGKLTPSTGQGPLVVKWSTIGLKHLTLTVSDGVCPSTASKDSVQVNAIPTATFNGNKDSICVGATSTFTYKGNASAGANYNWNFGKGTVVSGSGQGPYNVTWPGVGIDTVTLQVTDNGCVSAIQLVKMFVDSIPTSAFTPDSTTGCQGYLIGINYFHPNFLSKTYVWGLDSATMFNGNQNGSIFLEWKTTGQKLVTLTVLNRGCPSVIDSQIFTINKVPTSTFTSPTSICSGRGGAVITYTGDASAGANYVWNFGNALVTPGFGQGPQVVNWPIISTDTLQITLKVGENRCVSSLTTASVIDHVLPVATFKTSSSSICTGAPDTITYTGGASASATFDWNFGGGTATPSTGQGPFIVTWPDSGIKMISLAITDQFCTSDTFIVPDTVHFVPTASFSATPPGSICAGSNTTLTYTGTASSLAAYDWNFGVAAATPGTGQGPQTINWQGPGLYPIKLTVTENGCTSNQDSLVLQVNQNPKSDFVVDATGCVGAPILVTYTGGGLTTDTYTWNFFGGTTSSTPQQNPQSVSWSTPGQHEISLSVTENGCTSTVTDNTLTLTPKPAPAFSLSTPQICAQSSVTVTYTAPQVATSTYTWVFNGGSPPKDSGIGPKTVTYNSGGPFDSAGVYTINLIEYDGGCTDTATEQIIVNPIPLPSFTVSPDSVCSGSNVTINFNGTASPAAKYTWLLDAGQIQSGSVNGPGPLVVKYTSVNSTTENLSLSIVDRGCPNTTSFSTQLNVNPTPSANFNAPDVNGCNQLDVNFLNLSFGGSNYTWFFGDSTTETVANPGNVTHHYNNGTYNVKLIAMNMAGCSSDTTLPDYINVEPTPTALFSTTPAAGTEVELKDATFGFTNLSTGASTYLWSFGNGDSSTSAFPTYTYSDTGRYIVTLIAYNDVGCSDTFRLTLIVVPSNFVMFPNAFTPTGKEGNNTFKVYGAGIEAAQLSVFDRWGEKVYDGDGLAGWDGKLRGTMMNTDVYVYYARVVKTDGQILQMKGDVTLLK